MFNSKIMAEQFIVDKKNYLKCKTILNTVKSLMRDVLVIHITYYLGLLLLMGGIQLSLKCINNDP